MTTTDGDRLASLVGRKTFYVVEPLKLLYVSTSKNACTSMKWLVAELAGEDLDRFRAGTTSIVDPLQAIHRRGLFRRTPHLGQLSDDVRRDIRPDNGWFVWSIVRDPRIRMFSAWENKFLLHNPRFLDWRDQPWYPAAPPRSADDVTRSFARFVEFMAERPMHRLHRDSHFANQVRLLHRDHVDYSHVYEIGDLGSRLVPDLTAHLRAQGWHGELTLRRSNETPLVANRQAFPDRVRALVEQIYADDFAAFGDRWDFARIESAPEWSPANLADVNARIVASERVHELLTAVGAARARAERAEAQREALRAELKDRLARSPVERLRRLRRRVWHR